MKKYLGGKTLLVDLLFDIVGCFVLSTSIQCFSAPNNIAPGGVTGLSILVHYLFGAKISLVSLLINIPLLILAWILMGRQFTLRTLKTVLILTVMLEVCSYFPSYQGNILLAVLYGGVLEGIGLALVFMRSSTTGGSDLASRMIQLKFPYIPVGKLLMAVDGLVLIASALVYRNIESALYGLIVIYSGTKVIDSVLYGMDSGKVLMIISDHYQEIMEWAGDHLGRGSTILSGKGGYQQDDRPVLLCAVGKSQYIELKRIVRTIDSSAFMVVMEAGEIIGEGFKDIHKT